MKTFNKVIAEIEELQQVSCNCYGKVCVLGESVISDYLEIDVNWGYFSAKDGENHKCDVCEKCYDKFVKSFKIKPKIDSYMLLGE